MGGKNHGKSPDYLMLLYSVIAMRLIFSMDLDKRNMDKHSAAVTPYATEKRFERFTLQLCQTRVMLALYKFCEA